VRYHEAMLDPTLGAIIASGFAAVLIGMFWYHPKLFGGVWARLSGITPEMQERAKRRMPLTVFFGLLAAMLVAYVMTYVSAAWGFYNWQGALQLGIWLWLGFVAPTMLWTVLWDQKPFRLYLINVFYWLVTFIVIAQMIVFAYGLQVLLYPTDTVSYDTYDSGSYIGTGDDVHIDE
jgi:hypothetical protein